ncbi:phosphoribosylaminoimidazolesuccinocarboxamide synthase [Chloroflexota bacterium]
MMNENALVKTEIPLPLFVAGKVRDTYRLDSRLLIISTDRISAFDVVLSPGIPDKGMVLTRLSAFWFDKTKHIIPNHLLETVENPTSLDNYLPAPSRFTYPAYLSQRSMVVKKAERLPVECVVRGYLSGSAWAEYRKLGTVNGEPLPEGLKESQELPRPLFTPTTKADEGHDLPITLSELAEMLGKIRAEDLAEKSLAVYNYAREYAKARGIILADTKMEYGLDDGKLILIDELLTPDSSRFWDAGLYKIGEPQPSYDKQPVRDWLTATGWNKEPPAPILPPDVIQATTKRYRTAYERLTGGKLD